MGLIKEFFSQIGEIIDNILNRITDNLLVKKLIMVVGVFLLIFIIIALLASCSHNKVYTYEEFERKMISMAKTKAEKNNTLPKEDKGILEISLQSFVEDGQIKSIESVIQNKSVCTGNVKIINNNGYYLYIPTLDCGKDYSTKSILEELTNPNNITTSGNGLYQINNEYIFKGDAVNNYLSLNGITYRILKINEDGTLRVLDTTKRDMVKWDDRYNIDKKMNIGINNYIYNDINSRIKDYVESLYNNEKLFTDSMKAYFATTDVCIGKRSINDNIFDSSIDCAQTTERYPFTLITAHEYYIASLDQNCRSVRDETCSNYNYFSQVGTTWTITADRDTSFKAFKLNSSGVYLSNTSNTSNVKVITTLNGELKIKSGEGSKEKPYVINTFTKNNKKNK